MKLNTKGRNSPTTCSAAAGMGYAGVGHQPVFSGQHPYSGVGHQTLFQHQPVFRASMDQPTFQNVGPSTGFNGEQQQGLGFPYQTPVPVPHNPLQAAMGYSYGPAFQALRPQFPGSSFNLNQLQNSLGSQSLGNYEAI